MDKIARFIPYFQRSGGGVTFSGGEPLMQPAFLLEALRLCRGRGIHTCLDTAGVGPAALTDAGLDEILAETDLVLYDVKHWQPEAYRALTGQDIAGTEAFQQALRRAGTPVWVRHVVVPGRTDSPQAMAGLKAYIGSHLANVQKVELLPYHLLGVPSISGWACPIPCPACPPWTRPAAPNCSRRFSPKTDKAICT